MNTHETNGGSMQAIQGSEILIVSGMHQFQHGRIAEIDTATEIPFAHVQLRGRSGDFLTRSGAYVPLKYCSIVEPEVIAEIGRQAKAARKLRRAKDKAAAASQITVESAAPIEWES